ncbi:protein of unknown function [Caballeronia sp. S22]
MGMGQSTGVGAIAPYSGPAQSDSQDVPCGPGAWIASRPHSGQFARRKTPRSVEAARRASKARQ